MGRGIKVEQITEWLVAPLDEYGDSIEVYYCGSRAEAIAEREARTPDHPDAVAWRLERVVREYHADGELKDEKATEVEW